MKATLVYNFLGDDEHRIDVDLGRDSSCPLVVFQGVLFVQRGYVLGFIDNVSRQGANGNFYIQTTMWDVETHKARELGK